jgi:hypothetical protein
MEQIDGLEKLIYLLNSQNIVVLSFIIFVAGVSFFSHDFSFFISSQNSY